MSLDRLKKLFHRAKRLRVQWTRRAKRAVKVWRKRRRRRRELNRAIPPLEQSIENQERALDRYIRRNGQDEEAERRREKIARDRDRRQKWAKERHRLNDRAIPAARTKVRRWRLKAETWAVKAKHRLARIRRKRRQQQQPSGAYPIGTPSWPHWGGSDDILEREAEPVARARGLEPNSAKRSETYGNPTSDHHTSQVWASARDWPTANNYSLRDAIAREIVGRAVADYENVYFRRGAYVFRYQAIAGTHGTGPHLHNGIRRA